MLGRVSRAELRTRDAECVVRMGKQAADERMLSLQTQALWAAHRRLHGSACKRGVGRQMQWSNRKGLFEEVTFGDRSQASVGDMEPGQCD